MGLQPNPTTWTAWDRRDLLREILFVLGLLRTESLRKVLVAVHLLLDRELEEEAQRPHEGVVHA